MATDGPKPPKKYIKSTVTVHDRTQIETVFDYFLFRGPTRDAPPQSLRYKVEAFLFYPRQFGLEPSNYPKERFFSDVRPLLRFREPKLGFKALLGQKPGTESPLVYLKGYIAARERGEATEPTHAAVDEVRLLGCALVGSLLRSVDRNRKRLSRLNSEQGKGADRLATTDGSTRADAKTRLPDDATPATPRTADQPALAATSGSRDARQAERARVLIRMTKLLDRTDKLLAELRALAEAAARLPEDADASVLAAEVRLVDEYCHYRLRDAVAYLLLTAQAETDLATSPEAEAFRARVVKLLATEDAHAERSGYARVHATSTEDEKERFVHRRGELKRRIWSVLFLELRRSPLFEVRRQFGAMVAAGLAAIWYAFAQILLFLQVAQPQRMRDFWGISGMLFLLAATFAYVIKDRIKEFGRSYFGGGILRKIPDHSEEIYYANRVGKERPVGQLQEAVTYIDPHSLPERIAHLHATLGRAESCELEASKMVLHYTKNIMLSGQLRILNRYPLRAVHDILRLNVGAGLPRLGEATQILNLVTTDARVDAVELPKVYYLDLVLSYSRQDQAGASLEQALDYFRLVIDKHGLLRIERLT